MCRPINQYAAVITALTEGLPISGRLRRPRQPTQKTVSYRTASRRWRARLLHVPSHRYPVKGSDNGLSMATEKCKLLAIEKCTLVGSSREGSGATGAGAPE